ncbi:hypothetical protein C8F04DRAFT_71595 [Mycena alexandri]|uniref:Uncharacterized protein n=1 Tax=Mycena alexandri TaxID=1745969 RepID=A0AAD6SLM0_9AGAR|nr:hypothetical protein C8F04DRAFT_71595 [Mycena alexandri]
MNGAFKFKFMQNGYWRILHQVPTLPSLFSRRKNSRTASQHPPSAGPNRGDEHLRTVCIFPRNTANRRRGLNAGPGAFIRVQATAINIFLPLPKRPLPKRLLCTTTPSTMFLAAAPQHRHPLSAGPTLRIFDYNAAPNSQSKALSPSESQHQLVLASIDPTAELANRVRKWDTAVGLCQLPFIVTTSSAPANAAASAFTTAPVAPSINECRAVQPRDLNPNDAIPSAHPVPPR